MVDYAAAIKKPFNDIQTLGIGIILGAIPVINFLVTGYGIGVARKVSKKDNKLPKWDPGQIIQYIKDFVISLVISLVYLIPAGIFFTIGGALAIGSIITAIFSGSAETAIGSLVGTIATGGIFLIIGAILAIIGGLMAIMGVVSYAKQGSIGAAFKFGAILKKVLTGNFIAALVICIVYSAVLFVVAILLSIVPIIGSLIGFGLMGYATTVTGYTLFAEVLNETP
ncbi:MAG: DUF4013 domain-containing protein [archaeon]|nr:DUF4013 domain-containing protein [archaeon]